MSAPPYMPLYVADYLGDTRHLSTEQHGAYLLLLMAMWRAGGRLPNEGVKLARIAGLTSARWAKLEADVIALFDVRGDEIGHKRIQKEFEKYTRTSAQRKEAGSLGGKSKSLKNKDPDLANATIPLEQKPTNQNQNQNQIEGSPNGDLPFEEPTAPSVPAKRGRKSVGDLEFEEFWKLYPRKVGKGAAEKAFRSARKFAPLDEILEGLSRYRQQREGDDPQFTKHAATWLNGKCWTDEPEERGTHVQRSGPVSRAERNRAEFVAGIEEVVNRGGGRRWRM